ncbi:MAG: GrpB family protein [SAR202 cluster bacterium]|nr:GrpB family protein [SAR202 cluster bacterium]
MDTSTILGTPPGKAVLVPYAPEWPNLFFAERTAIQTGLGPLALQIHHIGSTSIPGMPAKPTMDIVVVIPMLEDHSKCIAPLEALGYRSRGSVFEGEPDHLYF